MRDDLEIIFCTTKFDPTGYSGRRPGWWAQMEWCDGVPDDRPAVEGTIGTRYYERDLAAALDACVEVAKTFGLPLSENFLLLYHEDGESLESPPPAGWRETLRAEADRRGWRTYVGAYERGTRPRHPSGEPDGRREVIRGDLISLHTILDFREGMGWRATMPWYDARFCADKAVEGEIRTRHFHATPEDAIAAVRDVAQTFEFALSPDHMLLFEGDGRPVGPSAPRDFERLMLRLAQENGWYTYDGFYPEGEVPRRRGTLRLQVLD